MKYRAEIDGLRALAVLPVIIFHSGVEMFGGGFLGVDIFFVISGYLITYIIYSEILLEQFSLSTFYERRARRILPALIFVAFLSIPFAWFILLPIDFKDFGQSLVGVASFVSNIVFWQESGYFGRASELKPLLHTWSLAIEEQFYLLFPLFLLLISKIKFQREKFLILGLIIAFLCSFLIANIASYYKPVASFFLLPSRGWELLLGSFAAIISIRNDFEIRNFIFLNFLSLLGFILIISSILFFSSSTPNPSFYTLAPTMGTFLIILFAKNGTFVNSILKNNILVQVGLISYSAYLFHQPIFAFYKYQFEENTIISFALIAFVFIFAYISWRYVEKPFRSKSFLTKKKILILSLFFMILLATIGAIISNLNGIPSRFTISKEIQQSFETSSRKDECFDLQNAHESNDWFCDIGTDKQSIINSFIVTGDSHALSLLDVIDSSSSDASLSGIFTGFSGCTPFLGIHARRSDQASKNCFKLNQRIYDYVQTSKNIKTIILIARWSYYTDGGYDGDKWSYISKSNNGIRSKTESRAAFMMGLEKTIKAYSKLGVKIILVRQIPEQFSDPMGVYFRSSNPKDLKKNIERLSVNIHDHNNLQDFVDSEFKKFTDIEILNFDENLCDYNLMICPIGDSERSFYIDYNHLTLLGAEKLNIRFNEIFSK